MVENGIDRELERAIQDNKFYYGHYYYAIDNQSKIARHSKEHIKSLRTSFDELYKIIQDYIKMILEKENDSPNIFNASKTMDLKITIEKSLEDINLDFINMIKELKDSTGLELDSLLRMSFPYFDFEQGVSSLPNLKDNEMNLQLKGIHLALVNLEFHYIKNIATTLEVKEKTLEKKIFFTTEACPSLNDSIEVLALPIEYSIQMDTSKSYIEINNKKYFFNKNGIVKCSYKSQRKINGEDKIEMKGYFVIEGKSEGNYTWGYHYY